MKPPNTLRRTARMQQRPPYGQLSGGQQQRVVVARAVVGSPPILLCDEPTGNLGSMNGAMVMDLLQTLHADGATICMVTHDPPFDPSTGSGSSRAGSRDDKRRAS